jgi:hypothetical protein
MFAGGAYIGQRPEHVGSLSAQDVVRLAIAAVIVIAVFINTALSVGRALGVF